MKSRLKIVPKLDEYGSTYLESLRIRAGYSISALARESGVSRKVIWQIETYKGSVHPRPDTVAKIIEALGSKLSSNGYGGCKFEDVFKIMRSELQL